MNKNVTEENIIPTKGERLYYAQILPTVGIYNVLEMLVSTVYDTYFACSEKREKHRYLFNFSDINKTIFYDRKECLDKVKYAEAHGKKVSNETYYKED